MKDLVIYGAEGAGRELANVLSFGQMWNVKGFIDDTKIAGEIINEIPILGGMEWLMQNEANVAMSIVGDPKAKRKLIGEIKAICYGVVFPFVMAEQFVFISSFIEWGEGCVVQPYNYLTVNIKIGDFVWINTRNDIGHDVTIGDYTTLFTRINVGGGVHIGKECVIGTGVTIRPGIFIGDGVTVGGGAVVVKDVPNNVTVVGNPARILERR